MEKIPFILDRIKVGKNVLGLGKYSILDEVSEDLPKKVLFNMNNTIGLEDGRWIRFVNVGNGSVIELSDRNALVCKPLNPDREEFQKFRCIFKGQGRFCIAAKYQPSEEYTMVWDYLPHRRLLIQKRLTDASWNTQIWRSGHVPGTESLYFVLSALEETSCLKNVGNGKQVLIVRKTDQVTADKFAQWQLEQLGPIT